MKHVTAYTPPSPLTQQLWEIKKKAATRKGPPDSSGKPTRETSKGGKPGTIERGSSYEGSQRFVHVTDPDGVMHKVLAKDAKAVASGRSSGKPHFRTTTVEEGSGGLKRTARVMQSKRASSGVKKIAGMKHSKKRSWGRARSIGLRGTSAAGTPVGFGKTPVGMRGSASDRLDAKRKSLGGRISKKMRDAKEGAKALGGKISSKMRGGADSVKRFGQGTMHGMKKGMQGTKGYKKGTAQKRGQWTGNKLRQGYRGAKKLGGKGIEGIKKHGPTVARGLKKGALASLHHGVKATRQIGGAVKSGWKAGGPKPKLQAPKAGAPAQAGAPAPAARRPLKAAPAQGGGSRGQGGGGGNQTQNVSQRAGDVNVQVQSPGVGGGGQQQQQGRGAKGGRRVGDNAKGEKKKPLTGKEQGQWDRDREIAKGGGLIKRRIRQISGGTSRVAQGVMNAAQSTGGNA